MPRTSPKRGKQLFGIFELTPQYPIEACNTRNRDIMQAFKKFIDLALLLIREYASGRNPHRVVRWWGPDPFLDDTTLCLFLRRNGHWMVVLVDSVDATPVFFLCRAITFKMPRSKISVKISLRAEVALCSSSFHDAMMDDSRESNRSDSAVMVRSGNVCELSALHPHISLCASR